ncbi:hypothetical protein, partial [Vibrio cholerae]|uniref:hypothetical protein n=1 Tax=Vibrio cholerae TaxID=666 RepID=UPI0018F0C256
GQPELFDFDWQSFTTPIHGFPLPSGPGALVAPPNPAIGVAIGLGVSLLILALGIMFFSARTVSSETSPTDEPHSERTTLLPNQLQ